MIQVGRTKGRSAAYSRAAVVPGGAPMTDFVRGVRCVVVASLLLAPASTLAQESRSAQLASELVKLLDLMKLDSAAAKLDKDEYAGALHFAGTQLLVVKARYIVPERMDAQLAQKNYRDVYIDLNSASVPAQGADCGSRCERAVRAAPRESVRYGGPGRQELFVRRRLGPSEDFGAGLHQGVPNERY